MASTKQAKRPSAGEELGLKLLQSVREMKARNFARSTEVAPNEVGKRPATTVLTVMG